MESLCSWSDLPPDCTYGSNLSDIIIADVVFLPYISFIIAFVNGGFII